MFPVTPTPLPLLPLLMVGLSQYRLCSLHSKEPMTEQPTVLVPSLLVCHPNIERDEKNPGLHCCTFALYLSPSPTRFEQGGIPTTDEHKFPSFVYTIHTFDQFVSSPEKDYLLQGECWSKPSIKSFNFRRYFQTPNLIPPFSILLCL